MALVRINPFREIAAIQNMMDRVFYDTWRSVVETASEEVTNTLAVDVYETPTSYTIYTDIPGIQPENIHVRLENDFLYIEAELPQQAVQAEGSRLILQERPTGRVSRRLQFAKPVDFNQSNAVYENGVLILTVPKTPEAQSRTITVKSVNGHRANGKQ